MASAASQSNTNSTQNRSLKRLNPTLSRGNWAAYHQLLQKLAQGVYYQRNYLIPGLEHRNGAVELTLKPPTPQSYQQHRNLLLPADLVVILTQLTRALEQGIAQHYSDEPSLTKQHEKLGRILELAQNYNLKNGVAHIELKQEQELAAQLGGASATGGARELKLLTSVAHQLLITFNQYYQTPSPQDEESVEENQQEQSSNKTQEPQVQTPASATATSSAAQEDKAADSATVPQPSKPQGSDIQKEVADYQLINSSANKVISSLTELSLQTVLRAYTQVEANNELPAVDGLDFNQLPPELQRGLRQHLRAKIENVVFGLSAQEISQLVESRGDGASIRLKILQQAHLFMRLNPRGRILLQTAVQHHFHQLRANPAKQQQVLNKHGKLLDGQSLGLKQVQNHLQQAARDEQGLKQQLQQLSTDPEQNPQQFLKQAFDFKFDSDTDFEQLFQEHLTQLLPEQTAEHGWLPSVVTKRLNNTIASLIIADPTLSPRFLEVVSTNQLSGMMGVDLPEHFKQNPQARRSLVNLLKQYWTLYRADRLRHLAQSHPDLNLHYQHPANPEQTYQWAEQRLKQALKQSSLPLQQPYEGERSATDATHSKSADQQLSDLSNSEAAGHSQANLLFWDQMPKWAKQVYLQQNFPGKDSNQVSREEIKEDFSYYDYIRIVNDAVLAVQTRTAQAQQEALRQEAELGAQQLIAEQQLAIAQITQAAYVEWQTYAQLTAMAQQAAAQDQLLIAAQQAQTARAQHTNSYLLHSPQGGGQGFEPEAAAGQALQAAGGLAEAGAKQAAKLGLRAAIASGSGGLTEAIPEPIKNWLLDKVVDLGWERLKKLLKILLAAITAFFSFLIALLSKLATLGAALTGAALGGVVGLAIGGPAGALIGVLGGGLLGGLGAKLSGKPWLGNKARQAAPELRRSAQQGMRGASRAGADLTGQARSSLAPPRPPHMTPQQYFAQYPRSALGLSKTPSPGLIKAVFSGPASASLATTISLTVGGTLMTFMVIQAAFLANFPYTGVTAEDPMSRESRYIKIEKTAHTDCHSNHPDPNTCPNPQFPIQAEYKLKISPKENYTVTITTLSDQLVVDHNQKHYREELGQEPPEIAKRTKSLQDFELSQNDLTINPGESLVITYQEELSEDYNHALVRNKAKVEFNYSGSDGAGQDYATSYEVIRLGEYPEGLSCWPASGTITQLPYENAPSHEVLDAYDIAAPIGTPIFAPFDGELCPGHIDSNYGVHSTLKTSINNETYVLLFGHLAEGSSIVSHACQQVSAGDVIGFMDDTGWSTGSHLHYELRAGYDNTYTLTELVPGGQSGEPISKQMYVTSCYEEGYQ